MRAATMVAAIRGMWGLASNKRIDVLRKATSARTGISASHTFGFRGSAIVYFLLPWFFTAAD
jgi:hypothetical protein